MIFKIADGREYFYQWDIDRQIIVSDLTIKEVHFCNRTDDCSLVVEVVDGVANVPNIILQKSFDVRVFGYDGKATLHEATFKVKARTQPADYVYTETVVKSIEEILEAAETVTTTANEFYEFVEDHTLGLTDDGEGNVELITVDAEGGNVDLTDYYTKTEVNELIENIDIPETDLTGYATEEYVDAAVKSVEVDESKFASKDHSHTYSSLTGKPVIPSIEGLASEEYVDEAVKNAKPDLTGYATEEYVDNAIAAIEIPEGGGDADLSNYYTKEETYSKTEVDDLINNIEIPEGGGGTGGDVDLSDYYTKEETDELISGINQCDTYFFNAEAVEWQNRGPTPAPASLAEFAQRVLAGEAVNLCVAQIVEGNVRWVPAEFYIAKTTSNVLCVEFEQGVSVKDIGKEGILQPYRVYPEATVGWAVTKLTSFPKFIADKTYVDEAIQDALNAIGVAEGGAY